MSGTASTRIYFLSFFALLFLTFLTVTAAFINFGPLNIAIALTIAVIKATLVTLYFMHLRYSIHLARIFVAGGLLWLILLITGILPDFMMRDLTLAPSEKLSWIQKNPSHFSQQ